jgi:3-hydroxyacyl-CoA dehydrogenase
VLGKAAEHRKSGSIVASNTSGISIAAMCKGLDEESRWHFLGPHFFNSTRNLRLLEIIPAPDTDPEVIESLIALADKRLGKGVDGEALQDHFRCRAPAATQQLPPTGHRASGFRPARCPRGRQR